MSIIRFVPFPLIALTLASCNSEAERQEEAVENRVEMQAETSARTSGGEIAALGLTERQLLDADLVTADGRDPADIEQIRRDAAGAVEGFLVSIEGAEPDRYVIVPLEGLTPRVTGNNTDLQTSMTADEIAALPDAPLDVATPEASGAAPSR